MPLAVSVLESIAPGDFRLFFGAFLVLYAGYMLAKRAIGLAPASAGPLAPNAHITLPARETPPWSGAVQTAVGFGAGFVGGLTAMPGALVTVWCDLQNRGKESLRGVVQPFILMMQLCALAMMAGSTALLQQIEIHDVAFAIPSLAAGTAIGLFLFGRADNSSFRVVILVMILISGSGLVLQ